MSRYTITVVEDDQVLVLPLFQMVRISATHIWFQIGAAQFDLEIVGSRIRWISQSDQDHWMPDMLGLSSNQDPKSEAPFPIRTTAQDPE